MLWILNLGMGGSEAVVTVTRNRVPSGFPILIPGVMPDNTEPELWRKAAGWSILPDPLASSEGDMDSDMFNNYDSSMDSNIG